MMINREIMHWNIGKEGYGKYVFVCAVVNKQTKSSLTTCMQVVGLETAKNVRSYVQISKLKINISSSSQHQVTLIETSLKS
jgi:hypothetical protein